MVPLAADMDVKDLLGKAVLGIAFIEGNPPGALAHAPIAVAGHGLSHPLQVPLFHLHQNVDDGLGPDAGDGCGADVVELGAGGKHGL